MMEKHHGWALGQNMFLSSGFFLCFLRADSVFQRTPHSCEWSEMAPQYHCLPSVNPAKERGCLLPPCWPGPGDMLGRAWLLPSSELSPGPLKVGVILMSQLRKTGQERGGKRPSQDPALRKWQAWELGLRSPIMRLTRCLLCSEGRQGLGSLTLKPCPKQSIRHRVSPDLL